ncbi:5265_t:CDS:2, partial [Acaulospora colombiana]
MSLRTPSSSILGPISTSPPPTFFESKPHPQKPANLDPAFEKLAKRIPTNKFYTNLLVGNAQSPVYPLPYALRFESGVNNGTYGFSISNTDEDKFVFGPDAKYFYSIYTQSITMSAIEFETTPKLLLSEPDNFSINAVLVQNSSTNAALTQSQINFPIVRGMAFVTAKYENLTPLFESGVGFSALSSPITLSRGVIKYSVTLTDGSKWLIYAINNKEIGALNLEKTNATSIRSTSGVFNGIIQVAKVPQGNS